SRFKPMRLSLNGLSGYYTLQTPDLPAGAMPSHEMDDPEGYRTEFGTSIACRIDPTKERGTFDLSAMLNSHILFPTIPIEFEGVKVAGYSTLIGKPWCTAKTVKLTAEQARSVETVIHRPVDVGDLVVEFLPLDLTGSSGTTSLKGQAIVAHVLAS